MVTPRSVVALDVTTTHVSMCKLEEGDPEPRLRVVDSHSGEHASHTVASTCHRTVTARNDTMELVADGGNPTLVVMTKLSWNTMGKDPSFARRAGLWTAIAIALCDLHIPVAEIPILTVQAWAGVKSSIGKDGFKALEENIRFNYPDISPPQHFRLTAIAVAVAGCMALSGFETPWAVTQPRLNQLRGYVDEHAETRSNKGVQWPHEHHPPRTVAEWYGETEERESA
jgi:hypothetical protein